MTPRYSFEYFPPKSNLTTLALDTCISALKVWQPEFCSMTYGAGGSSQNESFNAIKRLQRNGMEAAAHITAVDATKAQVNAAAQQFVAAGVNHLVALRGDSPEGEFVPHPQGFQFGTDLVAGLRQWFDGTISVAGYPETHPQATSESADLRHLASKVDAGASQIMTQYCYDTDQLLRFVDKTQQQGIDVPIVVGVMPIHDIVAIQRFSARCGASVPRSIVEQFEALQDADDQYQLSVDIAVKQIERLHEKGLNRVHLYTLNRPQWVQGILQALEQPALAESA